NKIPIAPAAQPPGMERRETPILSLDEKVVRRGAAACVQCEHLAFAPDIVTVAIYTERKIQIQRRSARFGLLTQGAHLFLGLPLYIQMVLFIFFVIVIGVEKSTARRLGPVLPRSALPFRFRTERRVVLGQRMLGDETLEAGAALRGLA